LAIRCYKPVVASLDAPFASFFIWPEAFPIEVPAVHRPKERRRRKKPKRRIEMDRVMSLFHAVSVVPD
jgi:hypothetical protein